MAEKKKNNYNDYQQAIGNTEEMQQTQEYYDMQRDENYVGLLDKEIELENSKQNALKYTQNQLANQGFATQGYGSSVQAGIYNQYANAMQQAKSDYDFAQRTLNLEERNELLGQQQQNIANLDKLIEGAGSQEDLEKIYESYGLGTFDENGNFIMGEKPEGMSQFDWTKYNIMMDNSANSNKTPSVEVNGLGTLQYENNKGEIVNLASTNAEEISRIQFEVQNNKYEDGSVIKLTNSKRGIGGLKRDNVYLLYKNGQFSVVTEEEYNNAENKYYVTSKSTTKQ